MNMLHLNARGNGEQSYDFDNDLLMFKVKEREYLKSMDFDNFVIDIDKEGYIVGMRIFDASKIFKISRYCLREIQSFEFSSRVEEKIITIELRFSYMLRNKQIAVQGQNFTREASDPKLKDSEVLCSVA